MLVLTQTGPTIAALRPHTAVNLYMAVGARVAGVLAVAHILGDYPGCVLYVGAVPVVEAGVLLTGG